MAGPVGAVVADLVAAVAVVLGVEEAVGVVDVVGVVGVVDVVGILGYLVGFETVDGLIDCCWRG